MISVRRILCTIIASYFLWFYRFAFSELTSCFFLTGAEDKEINYPNEKSPLLEMREEINHVSNKDKHDLDGVNTEGHSQEMSWMPYHPDEEKSQPEMVRCLLNK